MNEPNGPDLGEQVRRIDFVAAARAEEEQASASPMAKWECGGGEFRVDY
jgi:hypothetical protein